MGQHYGKSVFRKFALAAAVSVFVLGAAAPSVPAFAQSAGPASVAGLAAVFALEMFHVWLPLSVIRDWITSV